MSSDGGDTKSVATPFRSVANSEQLTAALQKHSDSLKKWGILSRLAVSSFKFDFREKFDPKDATQTNAFFTRFLRSDAFRSSVNIMGQSKWEPVPSAVNASVQAVPSSLTSIRPLRVPLEEKGAVHSNGIIQQCYPVFHEDFSLNDELRRALLLQDDDEYADDESAVLYEPEIREEFLFQLWRHFVVGGSLCQWDDTVTPYLECTRDVYKAMMIVTKNPNTDKVQVNSKVFKLGVQPSQHGLFSNSNEHNVCYVVLDLRNCNLVYYYFSF